MKFNLRHIVFWLTIACIALAVLRRPILFLVSGTVEQSHFLTGFSLPFVHWLWLFNLEWVIDWEMVNNHDAPNPLPVFGSVLGGIVSVIGHILLLVFASCGIQDAWAWCNKDANG